MTVRDDILAEVSKGPRSYTYLESRCSRPNLPDGHVMRVLAEMVNSRTLRVSEWRYEKGILQPVYARVGE